jgi:hypothetical protein
LSNPVRDAREIRDILKADYYIDEVRELYDREATAGNIRRLFDDLRQKAGRNDSVFVFYAGHGQTDEITKSGSWIPVDGGRDQYDQTNWLPDIQVGNMLAALPARHVFLVSDSHFPGDILDMSRDVPSEINSEYLRRAYSLVSRQVMTSGGAGESVPDASEFALQLKNALSQAEGPCIDPEYLFMNVRELRYSHPQLGSIKGSEHQQGGSFLFFRRPDQTAAAQNQSAPIIPQNLRNNLYYLESLKLLKMEGEAYDRHDYDAASQYSAEAQRYAQLSNEYVALQLKIAETNNVIAAARTRLDWAVSIKAAEHYPTEIMSAQTAYAEAVNDRKAEEWDRAIEAAGRVIKILANINIRE